MEASTQEEMGVFYGRHSSFQPEQLHELVRQVKAKVAQSAQSAQSGQQAPKAKKVEQGKHTQGDKIGVFYGRTSSFRSSVLREQQPRSRK